MSVKTATFSTSTISPPSLSPPSLSTLSTTSSPSSTPTTPPKCFGITQAISHAPPTPQDLAQDEQLLATLKKLNSFESPSETHKRVQVIAALDLMVKKWVQKVTGHNLSGRALPFGSFRLNVHSPGSDIDTLVVVPWKVTRKDFFESFVQLLRDNQKVTELNAVPTAFVPIITLKFDGIDIDLLFARLNVPEVTNSLDLLDDQILKNMDEQSVRSINGYRVGERIRELVPDVKVFGIALRTIKLWAKAVGVYSNAFGFLGGISWAILVARTCQLYPTATPSKIVEKMFFIFSTWDWKKTPIALDHIRASTELPHLNQLMWRPNRSEMISIITPAFPPQNSTFNVSRSTAMVIEKELKDGLEMCKQIRDGKKEWKHLLEKINFFSRHGQFLALVAASPDTSTALRFSNFYESKLRKLVVNLEFNPQIQLAHLDTKSFEVKKGAKLEMKHPLKSVWFIGLQLEGNSRNLDLTREIESFRRVVRAQAEQDGVELDFIPLKQSALVQLVAPSVLKEGRFVRTGAATGNVLKRKNGASYSTDSKRVKH